jgi:type II secretory pathway pseudopilin PulG
MKTNLTKRFSRRAIESSGFSTLELVIVMAVMLIVTAVALPSFFRSLRTYQLNDAATRVASMLKFTRYEAIRLNVSTTLAMGVQPGGNNRCPGASNWCLWTDSIANTNLDGTENQTQLIGNLNLVAAGNAPPGLAGAVGAGALTDARAVGFVAFDRRGAVAPAAVDVLYVQNAAYPDLGFRAVVLLPSGSVEIWTRDSSTTGGSGVWRQVN